MNTNNNSNNLIKLSKDVLSDSGKELDNSIDKTFLLQEGVKKRKDERLKATLRALILERGMSEPQFFNKIGIIRQYWYSISWGLDECPEYLKVKISQTLGVDSRVIWGAKDGN